MHRASAEAAARSASIEGNASANTVLELEARDLLEALHVPAFILDEQLHLLSYTSDALRLLAPSEREGSLCAAERLASMDLLQDIRCVLSFGEAVERMVRLEREQACYLARVVPCSPNAPRSVLVVLFDVGALATSEERQRLRVAELNHRVRNMLQWVANVANQTLDRCEDTGQFKAKFFGRIQALACAYETLTCAERQQVSLGDLIRAQLAPFATEGRRFSVQGEPLVLLPNAALSLGLVVYELATNATKYGALSVPSGHVHIDWQIRTDEDSGARLALSWRESGGPDVKPAARHGFGSELVQRQLKYELNGEAVMDFAPDGLRVSLFVPIEEVSECPLSMGDR